MSQTREKGATTPVKKKAKQTAIDALQRRLFDLHYEYVVLDDPNGSGFLVYALGAGRRPSDAVLAGHFRVTVSADGKKAEKADALSRTRNVVPTHAGTQALWIIQLVSEGPVETFIYLSNVHRLPIFVETPDRTIWKVDRGKVQLVRDKKDAPRTSRSLGQPISGRLGCRVSIVSSDPELGTQAVESEFVCIPRPIARATTPDARRLAKTRGQSVNRGEFGWAVGLR